MLFQSLFPQACTLLSCEVRRFIDMRVWLEYCIIALLYMLQSRQPFTLGTGYCEPSLSGFCSGDVTTRMAHSRTRVVGAVINSMWRSNVAANCHSCITCNCCVDAIYTASHGCKNHSNARDLPNMLFSFLLTNASNAEPYLLV